MSEKNKIVVDLPSIKNNRITYTYEVFGEWKELFHLDEKFWIEYNIDISEVPIGIAVVPLLANLLPMAWVCDAEIIVPVCDKAFYDSIEQFKEGYINMYPMIEFKGKITAMELQENHVLNKGERAAFFSGGVDAFNTLVCHVHEKPILVTLWGADVKLEDEKGWLKVYNHISKTAKEFDVEFITVKSSFRYFLDTWKSGQRVIKSNDNWWHGFQHGIGIISHAAPVSYVKGIEIIYFASSFTEADKGKITCASDPTIDNYVKFCDSKIVHDGYEFDRQMKVHNITEYSKRNEIKIPLRVCWESQGGDNCCNCEKCWRTILSIIAEGENPQRYDFNYSSKELTNISNRIKYRDYHYLRKPVYRIIQKKMKENLAMNDVPKEVRWFYNCKIDKKVNPSIFARCINKVSRKIYKV